MSAQAGRLGHPHGVPGQVAREEVHEERPSGLWNQSPGRVMRRGWPPVEWQSPGGLRRDREWQGKREISYLRGLGGLDQMSKYHKDDEKQGSHHQLWREREHWNELGGDQWNWSCWCGSWFSVYVGVEICRGVCVPRCVCACVCADVHTYIPCLCPL